jgi:RNA polymerase sigma-70 factor (ECF subfamily)
VSAGEVTSILLEASRGEIQARDRLFLTVYPQFRALAQRLLSREDRGHTLQPTALVHEAYLKLVDQRQMDWKSRSHFFAVGAMAMRRILVDHARSRSRDKRGGGSSRIPLEEGLLSTEHDADILAVDEALNDLAELDERHAKIVELRFFGGLSEAESAEVLGISERTVRREWRMCRAWLRERLGPAAEVS